MRKSVWAMLGLAALAAVIVAIAVDDVPPQRQPASPPETLLGPPPDAANVPSAAAPEQPSANTSSGSASTTPPARPKPAVPDLPTIEVSQRPVHVVPDQDTPAPKVTLFDRKGKELPSSRQAALTPPSPPPASAPSAPFAPLTVFGGPAQAAGGTALAVAGKSVPLFGVRIAELRDRCSLGFGDNRNCADVARDTLAQRLKRYPTVSCHVPPGQSGNPGAICIDNSGTDLGGFLVAEGLALADTTQSYEYFGAEGVARSFRRGLWHNR